MLLLHMLLHKIAEFESIPECRRNVTLPLTGQGQNIVQIKMP